MQKILYLGIILVGILIVISGLALWKPVQFSELAALFGTFSIGLAGYAAVAAQIRLTALVTAATSRHTVNRTLETVQ